MKVKSSKIYIILFLVLTINNVHSQTKYSIISADSIKIASFGIDNNREQFISSFGKPISYKEYSDPYPPDRGGMTYYYTYDSLTADFIDYYGKVVLGSIEIKNPKHAITIGNNFSFHINDSVNLFFQFKDSYKNYIEQNKEKKQYEECRFTSNIRFKNSIGLMNVIFVNGVVTKIIISRDED